MIKRVSLFALYLLLYIGVGSAQTPVYKNPKFSAEQRAADLLSRLTLDEKISLMRYESPAIPRLGIKQYNWWSEALHGVGRSGTATVFPQCVGMAASFNDDLLFRVFTAVSDEARAKNTEFRRHGDVKIYQGLTFWTPNINIFRDPRWGRGQETYGEDPFLTGRMGMAVVRGLQGEPITENGQTTVKTLACAKHFAVHSGPEWNRHQFNAENIAPRDLWETYMPAFHDLVTKAEVRQVMCAYNRYEDEPCCGSNRLLQQILRNDWGYKHVVVSDCWALSDFYNKGMHEVDPDAAHAGARALLAGTDVECGESYRNLKAAVEQGLTSEERINTAVLRLLTERFALGEMDSDELVPWTKIPLSVVDSKEHRKLALDMARQSIVLLKNDGILPLKPTTKVAVMGPNANDSLMQWGNYNGFPSSTTTLLKAMEQRYSNRLVYERGCDHTSSLALESLFENCSSGGKKGFEASYWNQLKAEGTPVVVTQAETPFKFTTAGATVFAPGVKLGGFTGIYKTTFKAPKTEELVFSIQIQGQFSLHMNGKRVFGGGNMKNNHFYAQNVEAGKEYDIRLEFYASEGECASLYFDLGREVPRSLNECVEKVKDADVVIFAGGISPQLEGEEMPVKIPGFKGGDRETIELPAIQTELLRTLRHAGKKVVFVNFSGSAIAFDPSLCDAAVQAWYPGQSGGEAVAQVLMGEYNPAGRLPVTFYQKTSDLPDFQDYSMKGRTYRYFQGQALYPFGYGLSYTSFSYGAAKMKRRLTANESLIVVVPVKNTGKCDGEEVVQVYLRRNADTEGPIKSLRGFARLSVPKGKTKNVKITLTPDELATFDAGTNTMRVLPGEYTLYYGGSSASEALKKKTFTIYEK